MGEMEDFPGVKAQECIDAVLADLERTVAKYRTKEGCWDYESALALQKEQQRETYGTVSFHLGEQTADSGEEGIEKETNTELLQRQKNTPQMLQELVERIYRTGRYVQAACAGYSAPRLCGLWTGEWNPGWSGAYTMDANVNIQVSGMNTGHMEKAAWGYMYFILRQIGDWTENAKAVYGMWDALLAPVNTDGNRAIMVEYDIDYPFQYWNAGASWLMVPIFEYWQCFGNRQILLPEDLAKACGKQSLDLEQEILRPLLWKIFTFGSSCVHRNIIRTKKDSPIIKGKDISGRRRTVSDHSILFSGESSHWLYQYDHCKCSHGYCGCVRCIAYDQGTGGEDR